MGNTNSILIINGGSSSIKFSLYEREEELVCLCKGTLEGIGTKRTKLNFIISAREQSIPVEADDYNTAALFLIDWLKKQQDFSTVSAIGHRIVHGMKHTEPELIDDLLLAELKEISAYAPEHLPGEIKLVELFHDRYPEMTQIACFDTSFHTNLPLIAKLFPIPRKFYEEGIQRYGFHGISYSYLMEELGRASEEEARGKVILAHLGNGASLAAVKEGQCMDTSMGFTPSGGLAMSTRTGDLDPGVLWYLIKKEKLTPEKLSDMINHQSGLLGISEISSDMRALVEQQAVSHKAAEAIDFFCYQVKKWVGSFAAAMGGVDTIVFSGGIGENSREVRNRICGGLQFLGIELEEFKNTGNESVISAHGSRVKIRVIKTNEELMIARSVLEVLKYSVKH